MSGSNTVPPISSHPAFSKAVAVWFSALFGLGLLVLPHFAVEGMLGAVGLRGALSFFAAPLSTAAHLTVCAFGAVFGALVGLVIARRLAGSTSSEEESFAEPESEPIIAEAPVAEAPVSKAQAEPGPTPLPETAEPEIAEEPPAPSSARGSIANRLASRVRASENIEPSISDDVAALAADKETRDADHAAAAEYAPADDPADPRQDQPASSADILLAKMPTVERSDEWQSEEPAEIQAASEEWVAAEPVDDPEEQYDFTSAHADGDALDILSTADPLYDYDPVQSEATSDDAAELGVAEVESFLEESLIEDEPVATTPEIEAHEMQDVDYGLESDLADAPMDVVPEMVPEPAPEPETFEETAQEAAPATEYPVEAEYESDPIVPEIATVDTVAETAGVETAEIEAHAPETGRKPDLGQMLARLESAIGNFEAADEESQPVEHGDEATEIDEQNSDDPVVINLRQEAASNGAANAESEAEEDPQETLRKALDRLTQVSGAA